MYYVLSPEVPGELGPATEVELATYPPRVTRLAISMQDWLGDDLMTTFPCLYATRPLADALEDAGLSGFVSAEMQVTKGSEWLQWDPERCLPDLVWLQIVGVGRQDDFGTATLPTNGGQACEFVVSDRAMVVLQRFRLAHCEIQPFRPDSGR